MKATGNTLEILTDALFINVATTLLLIFTNFYKLR